MKFLKEVVDYWDCFQKETGVKGPSLTLGLSGTVLNWLMNC
jgi:hypothetical protein